jgi:hypothetical protein
MRCDDDDGCKPQRQHGITFETKNSIVSPTAMLPCQKAVMMSHRLSSALLSFLRVATRSLRLVTVSFREIRECSYIEFISVVTGEFAYKTF